MRIKKFGAIALAVWSISLLATPEAAAQPEDYLSAPAPDGYPSDLVTFETTSSTLDRERLESIHGDKLYPYDDSLEEVDLVVFYPGVGYGTQNFVVGNSHYGLGAAFASAGFDNHDDAVLESGVLFLIPRSATKPFASVEKTIKVLEEERGIRVRSVTMGGWSGGSWGLTSALRSDIPFRAVLYADPSPGRSTIKSWPSPAEMDRGPMLVNWYRKKNWGSAARSGGWYSNSNPVFLGKVRESGGDSYSVELRHNEILLLALVTGIKIAQLDETKHDFTLRAAKRGAISRIGQ